MFRPKPMAQLDILLLRRDLGPVLRRLADARIIHLAQIDPGAAELADEPPATELNDRYRAFSRLLRQLAEELGCRTDRGRQQDPADFSAWEIWARKLAERTGALRQRRVELERRREVLLALELFLRQVEGLSAQQVDLRRLRFVDLRIGTLPAADLGRLFGACRGARIYTLGPVGDRQAVVLLGLHSRRRELDEALGKVALVPAALPTGLGEDLPATRQRLQRVRKRLQRGIARLDLKLGALAKTHQDALRDRLTTIETELRLLAQSCDFAFTRRTVAIGGFVPRERMSELEAVLERHCPGRYLVRETRAGGDRTPVLFFNPHWLRPFQKILTALDLPAYGEVEPTPLLAFSFILLFGMMFGDLGHGLVLVAAGLILRRTGPWPEAGTILVPVGASAALFGLLFGSVFGWEGLFPPLWFSPLHHIPRLMAAALVVGVVLMATGMGLRILNGLGREPLGAVLCDRYGVAGLVFYLGSLVLGWLTFRGVLPPATLGWLLLPLLAVFAHPFAVGGEWRHGGFLLLCAEGTVEVMETVLGFLANTFSFLRVAAFGLAHVGLSMAVFALAEQARLLHLGWVPVLLVHLVGNLVILVLEGLIVSIQAVRLEFYEFFGKFFRGGGVAFHPLTLDSGLERRL